MFRISTVGRSAPWQPLRVHPGTPRARSSRRRVSVHMSTLRPREKVKQRNSQNHHFPMKNLHFWKTTRRPQVDNCPMWPQPGVVSFTTESDATDSDFPSGDPHAGPLGSADSKRPAATCADPAESTRASTPPSGRQASQRTNRERGHRVRSHARRPRVLAFFPKFELVVVC